MFDNDNKSLFQNIQVENKSADTSKNISINENNSFEKQIFLKQDNSLQNQQSRNMFDNDNKSLFQNIQVENKSAGTSKNISIDENNSFEKQIFPKQDNSLQNQQSRNMFDNDNKSLFQNIQNKNKTTCTSKNILINENNSFEKQIFLKQDNSLQNQQSRNMFENDNKNLFQNNQIESKSIEMNKNVPNNTNNLFGNNITHEQNNNLQNKE
jgi:hypothetical protein